MKITLTLNKANKLFQRLKQMRINFPSLWAGTTVNENVLNQGTFPSGIRTTLKRADEQFCLAEKVISDIYSLKEALFKANVESGVSAQLSTLGCLREMQAAYKLNYDQICNSDNLTLLSDLTDEKATEICDKLWRQINLTPAEERRYNRASMTFPVTLVSPEVLDIRIKSIQRQINDAEDQIAALNATRTFEFEFHDEVAELLGLSE